MKTSAEDVPLSKNVITIPERPQAVGVNTIILDPDTDRENFIFYFDRMVVMLIERYTVFKPSTVCTLIMEFRATENAVYTSCDITAPREHKYKGLKLQGSICAISILRGGSIMEPGLRRVIPDCVTGRVLIQTNYSTGEPELHFTFIPKNIAEHSHVLLLDPQMSSGGAALMAVRVLLDHGVEESRITFVTYFAGRQGLGRLMTVFPEMQVVACRIGEDLEERWIEAKYLGC